MTYRVGYSDGSGPGCIVTGEGEAEEAVAVVKWGCSCCEPDMTPEHAQVARDIVNALNERDRLLARVELLEGLLDKALMIVEEEYPASPFVHDIRAALSETKG